MAEYIEREALQTALQRKKVGVADRRYTEGWNDCLLRVKSMVHSATAADVAPVVHGRWEPIMEGVWNLPTPICVGWSCSLCGRYEQYKEPYCNCGARMDGE